MNINIKSENSKRFCCPKGLEKKMNFSPQKLITLNFGYGTLKTSLLKKNKTKRSYAQLDSRKTKRVQPTSSCESHRAFDARFC